MDPEIEAALTHIAEFPPGVYPFSEIVTVLESLLQRIADLEEQTP
jgi:hypothetical protein